jgi:diaminohydroxyphosphoribosylaminopyrimidine deaminase/5-amino-6-(5-phosphoribosylamino)uracil reductase
LVNADRDTAWMRRALFHAARGQGTTTPNPMVGAVVVSPDGIVVGQGYHRRAGQPHAEAVALDEAGDRARGATLYVTLEPCSHYGRTPPCTGRVIAAGVRRVVAAMGDPNPAVSGRGFASLRAHGITVDAGVLEEDAARLNQAYLTMRSQGRPLVTIKAAASLDARIAAAPGTRTAITSGPANTRTQRLRAGVDAIAVGSGTVLADDPLLSVRECHRTRPLARVVFDRRLRTPPEARLFSTLDVGPVIMIGGGRPTAGPEQRRGAGRGQHRGVGEPEIDPHEIERRRQALQAAGAIVLDQSGDLGGDVAQLLRYDVSSLLVEGGAVLHRAFWEAGLVDRVLLIVAPTAIGDSGVELFAGLPVPWSCLTLARVEMVGPDAWMEADVHRHR